MRPKYFTPAHSILWWWIMERDPTKGVTFTKIQSAKSCLANLRSILKDRLKNRFEITGGRANNPEHVGSRRLLLKGFTQLVQQARVLDCDDGLSREISDQLDLD